MPQPCERESHDVVRDLIVQAGDCVLLRVAHDPALAALGRRTTARLLLQRSRLALETATGIPFLTAEMTVRKHSSRTFCTGPYLTLAHFLSRSLSLL